MQGRAAPGKAELGDKTMIDALLPAVEALQTAIASGLPTADALRRSAEAAEQGMKATVPMVARKGRASYLGERSAGHQDPGGDLVMAARRCGRDGASRRHRARERAAVRAPRRAAPVIGLVVVSHSARLAEGVAELAAQVGGEHLRLAVAGGLDQPGDPLGTDAVHVVRAIQEAWSEDGVLVLMDLGSAVLSAEMALDLLPEERRSRVLLSEAPLVEGGVAAAVAAGRGATLEEAAEEARGGLAAKSAHLAPRRPQASAPSRSPSGAGASTPPWGPTLRLTVKNRLGLHARPAASFVQTAAGFDAHVTVSNATDGRGPVRTKPNAVATLGVRHGHEILVQATGPQAEEALAAIRRLADDDFGDPPQTGTQSGVRVAAGRARPAAERAALLRPSSAVVQADERAHRPAPSLPPTRGSVLHGLPASPGVAVGPAHWLQATPLEALDAPPADPAAELEALERALVAAGDEIRRARQSIAGRAGDYEAAIFDAHLLFLDDEALVVPARAAISGGCKSAARAWADAVAAAAAEWKRLDDPCQRARAADLRAVGEQVLRHLLHLPPVLDVGATGIVVAPDLTPAEIVRSGQIPDPRRRLCARRPNVAPRDPGCGARRARCGGCRRSRCSTCARGPCSPSTARQGRSSWTRRLPPSGRPMSGEPPGDANRQRLWNERLCPP